MGVLSVASETATPRTESRRVGDGQSSGETVRPGDRISNWVDEFLTGLVPFDVQIDVDWSRLSPIASVLSALASLVAAGGVFAWV